jgi:CDP-diglyceride synthetase
MILPLHILISLSSLVVAAYTLYAPSKNALSSSYTLVILTLVSGTYLVASSPSHMAQACMSGLVYVGVVFALIATARQRLVQISVEKD